MSALRLTFLYPHFFRSVRLGESAAQTAKSRCRKPPSHCRPYAAAFSTSTRAREAVFERHGKAVEPHPAPTPDAIKLPQPGSNMKEVTDGPLDQHSDLDGKVEVKAEPVKEEVFTKHDTSPPDTKPKAPTPQQVAAEEKMQSSGPMDAVLHMPPPSETAHPHISTPRYVHHFDTYGLVRQLEASGYSEDQAITAMKAIRTMLALNLDMAQDGLVSKSDMDNETYLFRAACSELSIEVKNNRKAADEETRQQRTLLQHEVDILGQKLGQDLMTLKDDVRGMFNDRKMVVREEQRRVEGKISQINLEISVTLNSDAKSDIEGLRWVLIRRSVLGILFMAFMTLATIRYATHVNHEKQKEADDKKRREAEMQRNDGRLDHARGPDAAEILAAN